MSSSSATKDTRRPRFADSLYSLVGLERSGQAGGKGVSKCTDRGDFAFSESSWDVALKNYESALSALGGAKEPRAQLAHLHNRMARCCTERREYDKAAEAYAKAAEFASSAHLLDECAFLSNKTFSLSKEEKYQEALDVADMIIALDPTNAMGYERKSDILLVLLGREGAEATCTSDLRESPQDMALILLLIKVRNAQGMEAEEAREYSGAAERFAQAYAMAQEHGLTKWLSLLAYSQAWSLQKLERFDSASAFLGIAIERASEDDPRLWKYLAERSVCYNYLAEYKAALVDAEKAIKLQSKTQPTPDVRIYASRVRALHGLSRRTEAWAAYRIALRLDPTSPELEEVARILQTGADGEEAGPSEPPPAYDAKDEQVAPDS